MTHAHTPAPARTRPWHGIMVATALPLRDDLTVDHDAYAEHVAWLIANGCDGVVPNGSLGEYQTLTDEERARVVRTAVEAAGDGERVMPGVAAYGSAEARRWADQAAEAGAGSVLLLPPNAFRADERAVRDHYAQVAGAGLPVVAYNNPIDTKVDLTPALLARLHADGSIVAVKEFSGDVRRAYEIAELAPASTCSSGPTTCSSNSPSPEPSAGSPATPTPCRAPAPPSTGPPSRATSTPRCRSTSPCTVCCVGTPRRSSSRPSSSPWTWPGAPAAPPAHPGSR